MNGLILIPKMYENNYPVVGKYLSFFNILKKEMNFRIEFTSDYSTRSITEDVVLLFRSPRRGDIRLFSELANLPMSKKLICYFVDLQTVDKVSEKSNYKKLLKNLMDRANKILCPYDYAFKKRFPNQLHKYINFPHFVNSEYFSKLELNKEPILKCLLSGRCNNKWYPLRMFIRENKNKQIITLRHPGRRSSGSGIKIGLEYVEELNKYYCGLASSSNLNYVVTKYFEISASGSLLLANYTPDLSLFGFEDGVNYIQINKDNFFDKLDEVLTNPEKYEDIREAGRKFVLKNFTEENNYEIFKKLFIEKEI